MKRNRVFRKNSVSGGLDLLKKGLELGISRFLFPKLLSRIRAMIIHLGLMLPSTSSSRTRGLGGRTYIHPPIWPCSRRGLPSSRCHHRNWYAFTAPFHLYNALRRCSLLSVALSIASPLLGVTQHPALWSPDFPHPDGKVTIGTRPSTQLKPSYYNLSVNLKAMKSERVLEPFSFRFFNHFGWKVAI